MRWVGSEEDARSGERGGSTGYFAQSEGGVCAEGRSWFVLVK
jgi:hypothetical protein